MKKIILVASLAIMFSLTMLPAYALEVDINYDNYEDTDADLPDSQNVIDTSVDNNWNHSDYVRLSGSTGLGNKADYEFHDLKLFTGPSGIAIIALLLILTITITTIILSLINVYHWGMTDKAAFNKVGIKKKKWYIILFIVPLVMGVVNILPIIGQIIAIIASIYYVIMTFVYFFSIRKKVV